MNKSVSSKPLIRSGWLRALLFLIAFLIAAAFGIGGYILGLHKGTLDAAGLQNMMKGDNLVFITGILFIVALLLIFIFRRWVDRKSMESLGFKMNGYLGEALAGGALAVFIISAGSLILKATGHLKWMDIIFDPRALFLAFGTVVLVAFYEELIFRGYVLSNLLDSFPKWLALLISAVLFMIFHWTSIGFFPMVNTLIMGLILGLNYIYTRNLWFSICFHIGWKFLEGPLMGFSGDDSFQTLLQTELTGDVNVTGGPNGLEGSFILTGVSLLCLVALYLFLQKKLNPQSRPVPGRI